MTHHAVEDSESRYANWVTKFEQAARENHWTFRWTTTIHEQRPSYVFWSVPQRLRCFAKLYVTTGPWQATTTLYKGDGTTETAAKNEAAKRALERESYRQWQRRQPPPDVDLTQALPPNESLYDQLMREAADVGKLVEKVKRAAERE